MRKKSFLYLGVFALVGILLTGCKTGKNSSEEMTKVTLNEVAHSIFYAPQYVAIEEGYFKDAGIDLTLVTGFGADKTMTALVSGEADIGLWARNLPFMLSMKALRTTPSISRSLPREQAIFWSPGRKCLILPGSS